MKLVVRSFSAAVAALGLLGLAGCAEDNEANSGIVTAPPPSGQQHTAAKSQSDYGKMMQGQSGTQNLKSQGYPGAR